MLDLSPQLFPELLPPLLEGNAAQAARALACLALFGLLGWMTKRDLEEFLLPDWCTYGATTLGLLLSLAAPLPGLGPLDALTGALVGPVLFLGIRGYVGWRTGRDGDDVLGLGDVKLAAAAGAWVGWQALPWFMLIGALMGLALFLAVRLLRRESSPAGPEHPEAPDGEAEAFDLMPFGPALCLALGLMVVSSLLGEPFGLLGPSVVAGLLTN